MAGPPRTLIEAIRYFSDQDVCFELMVALRWPNGVECPTCGSRDIGFLSSRNLFQCKNKHPRRQFSVKIGTVLEDSPIGLDKWLPAIWMIANAKNGVSSWELHRALGVTQKTAWFMLHRIRLAMRTKSFEMLSGEVEVDETFIGGKARFMHKDKRAEKIQGTGTVGKTAVMGLLERHGPDGHNRVTNRVVADTKGRTLVPAVREQVEPDSEVFTDALASYNKLSESYIHQVIYHAEAYAEGKVHTNGLENFWSLLKRAIKGTYVSVESYHLFRYLDEEVLRFNSRKTDDAARFRKAAGMVDKKRLTYRQLTGKVGAT